MGYGGSNGPGAGPKIITSSFAVEFDTEYGNGNAFTPYLDEGGPLIPSGCHTAYLKNGNMAALPGTFAPMQNDFGNVRNDSFCVRIRWKRTNGINGNAGYDLITCIEEKGNNSDSGKLIERNRMHFSSLSDFIAGLSEQNPYVNWGITSATCYIPNKHEIEFYSLKNGDNIDINDCEPIEIYLSNTLHQYQYITQYGMPPMKREKLYSNTLCCGNSYIDIFPQDTLTNKEITCLVNDYHTSITIKGIDMSNALWYIGDSLVASTTKLYNDKWIFIVTDYKTIYAGQDYVTVKAIVSGKEI